MPQRMNVCIMSHERESKRMEVDGWEVRWKRRSWSRGRDVRPVEGRHRNGCALGDASPAQSNPPSTRHAQHAPFHATYPTAMTESHRSMRSAAMQADITQETDCSDAFCAQDALYSSDVLQYVPFQETNQRAKIAHGQCLNAAVLECPGGRYIQRGTAHHIIIIIRKSTVEHV